MTYAVRLTGQARLDLKMICDYISNTLMAPAIAKKQYLRIETSIYSLDQMPERFRRYEKEPWQSRNLRIMPIDNYLVFYTVDKNNQIVTAIRIMYSARNIEKEFDNMAQ